MFDSGERPFVSYVLATYNRVDDLEKAIDSILEQNYQAFEVVVISNSTDETDELFADGGRFDDERIHYHHFEGRMGVPRARNIGFEHASGDIIVTIDDDAVLASAGATEEIVSLFRKHQDIGALAFRHENYYTGEAELNGTPDPPEFHLSPSQQYRAPNFVGVGNAIRRSTLEAAGPYPDDFVYGFEEMDLSLRIHDTGYDILYVPSVTIRHKESPKARRPDVEIQERLVENRIRIAVRNLPWRYVAFTTLIWSAYITLLTRDLSSASRVSRRLYEDRQVLLNERTVVHRRTIARVKSRRAMLYLWWYGPHPRRILGSSGDLRRLLWEA